MAGLAKRPCSMGRVWEPQVVDASLNVVSLQQSAPCDALQGLSLLWSKDMLPVSPMEARFIEAAVNWL